jgi:hypothetical protein
MLSVKLLCGTSPRFEDPIRDLAIAPRGILVKIAILQEDIKQGGEVSTAKTINLLLRALPRVDCVQSRGPFALAVRGTVVLFYNMHEKRRILLLRTNQ